MLAEILVVTLNGSSSSSPPPSPMPAVEEQLLVGQEGDDVCRAVGDT